MPANYAFLYINCFVYCYFFATKLLRSVQHNMNISPFSKSLVLCKIQLVGVYFHQY